jgi:hypothetical protein
MATKHEVILLEPAGTAYEIVPAPGGNGKDVTIQNNNADGINLYIGDEDVTTSSYGFVIKPGTAISFELDGVDSIWACSNDGAYAWVLSINLEKVRNG